MTSPDSNFLPKTPAPDATDMNLGRRFPAWSLPTTVQCSEPVSLPTLVEWGGGGDDSINLQCLLYMPEHEDQEPMGTRASWATIPGLEKYTGGPHSSLAI